MSSLAPAADNSTKSEKKVKPIIALGPAPKHMLRKKTADSGLFAAFGETFFMVVPSTPATRQNICKTDGNSIIILVDKGASEHYPDIDLHPGLRERMLGYEILKEPHHFIPAGEHVIEGIAKGTIIGTFNGQHGAKQWVVFSTIVVPGLRRHLFSPLVTSRMGVVTMFDSVQPRLEMGDVIVPIKSLDNGTIICSFLSNWTTQRTRRCGLSRQTCGTDSWGTSTSGV